MPLGALNLHPSLLPRHRGASPIPATILAGDERTGVTLMRMDAGLDTGPIVAVREVPLHRHRDRARARGRAGRRGGRAAGGEPAPTGSRGAATARPQPEAGATLTRPLRREDGRLDPTRPAIELERQVRAYQPWPGSWFETPAGRLTVWRARVAPGSAAPGRPTGRRSLRVGSGLGLATADGVLELLEVQPAGGRRMSGAELVRGRPGLVRGPGLRVVGG